MSRIEHQHQTSFVLECFFLFYILQVVLFNKLHPSINFFVVLGHGSVNENVQLYKTCINRCIGLNRASLAQ